MKIENNEIITTTEIIKQIFGMKERLIYNLSERVRYEQIYNYLIEAGAKELGVREFKGGKYLFLQLNRENYLIPTEIFDEFDEEWIRRLKAPEESVTKEPSSNNLISLIENIC
ncbi:hypothetical protein MWH25_05250 [Natroniella acetigena]|uniref:hypothetical protein n=1 Tax=Natroniella acetigena TaxID=52004 RepID=UPI00200B17B4|nr:hypothetical protein [Natroniella acetigena]MCK8827149.1 hypothetical protein [Natroniella acetigena]